MTIQKSKVQIMKKSLLIVLAGCTLLAACHKESGDIPCEPDKQEGCNKVYEAATEEPPKGTLRPVILKDGEDSNRQNTKDAAQGEPLPNNSINPNTTVSETDAVDDVLRELEK